MAENPTILVAGFGSWVTAPVNPAAMILKGLETRNWSDCSVTTLEVPVVTDELYERVEAALVGNRPDIWIGLGVSSSAAAITPEIVGVNWRHFSIPDATGATARMLPVIKNGPAAYNSDLPNEDFVSLLKEQGIPATLSFSAGTHLCNQMLYTARHVIDRNGLPTRSGFLHVPQSTENVAGFETGRDLPASMSLGLMTEAVAQCIEYAASRLLMSDTGE
ncbi:hypothetical protein [Roseibium sp. SCP14]|uniref:pyroglutamyl-peptidase I family protein n=1 Tax=Roseibium sp. SCP14 TaxID=3141375 RepID=UPI0033385EDF